MGLIDIFINEKKALELVEQYLPLYISKNICEEKKERCKWKVIVEGTRKDDLGPKPIEVPYTDELYFPTRKKAETIAKTKCKNADVVELWKLTKKW